MRDLTTDWVTKAEGDFNTARRELQVVDDPNFDGVAFHAHQGAEKYMKALLQESDLRIPKTHNLLELLDLLLPQYPLWESLRPAIKVLNPGAVEFRYPGEYATKEEAKEVLAIAKHIRQLAREELGLK